MTVNSNNSPKLTHPLKLSQSLNVFNLKFSSNVCIVFALLLGILTGLWDQPFLNQAANIISQVFINLLKLVSTPIIFLSILATVSGMNNVKEFKNISVKLIKYTLLTTYIAAAIALLLYLAFDLPNALAGTQESVTASAASKGYISYLIDTIPSNLFSPFIQSHVIAVLFLAILLSLATLALPENQRLTIHQVVSSFNALFMKIASWIIYLIPLAIWSFITLFLKDIQGALPIKQIGLYLATIVTANLIQGFIVLPLLVKYRGISPLKLAIQMLPALSLAFFSKSSSATLPMSIRCAQEKAGISKKLSNIAFPLCTAINMNGCAAFIFVTVLFVSMSNGVHFSTLEMVLWTLIATVAAIGNAGVPMGCYFLSTAFLVAMDVPLNLMAIILPFHALIDMLETAINVWSDSCVVAMVDREIDLDTELADELLCNKSEINI